MFRSRAPPVNPPWGPWVGFYFLRTLCPLTGHLLVVFFFLYISPVPQEQDASVPTSQKGLLLLRRRKNEDRLPCWALWAPLGAGRGLQDGPGSGPSVSLLLWDLRLL